ncbi:MAG: TolB family protein, partial [Chloroflexota bacterium]
MPFFSARASLAALLCLAFLAAACNLPTGRPANPPIDTPAAATVIAPLPPTAGPTPTAFVPPTEAPAAAPAATLSAATAAPLPAGPGGPALAFLHDRNLWIMEQPGAQPHAITQRGDISSLAWAPDGSRLAAAAGPSLCFFLPDGSPAGSCIDLGLDPAQASIERRLVWSPDGKWIVLWNPYNPWDAGAVGWLVVSVEDSAVRHTIQDPVEFGAALDPENKPGGITGEAVFLADGQLVGTLTHRSLCSDNGCHYQLFSFDPQQGKFQAVDNQAADGWSEGLRLAVSKDGRFIFNYGVFFAGCDSAVTFVD